MEFLAMGRLNVKARMSSYSQAEHTWQSTMLKLLLQVGARGRLLTIS